jgi:hypothetical protein
MSVAIGRLIFHGPIYLVPVIVRAARGPAPKEIPPGDVL